MNINQLKETLIGKNIIVSTEPIIEYAIVNDVEFKEQYNDHCILFEKRGHVLFLNLEKVKEFNPQIKL